MDPIAKPPIENKNPLPASPQSKPPTQKDEVCESPSLDRKIRISKNAIFHPLKMTYLGFSSIVSFSLLLIFFLFYRFFYRLFKLPIIPVAIRLKILSLIEKMYRKITHKKADPNCDTSIGRVNLIEMALRNMFYKKSRALITVGGMAVGVGSIVFLVSIGYGLQELVIGRVARLDELRQADVTTQPGSRTKLNDETIARFNEMSELEKTLPMIASVARVTFNNSVSDLPVYAVTRDYLAASAVGTIQGEIFDSNELAIQVSNEGEVSGVGIKIPEVADINEVIGEVEYEILAGDWVRVRSLPSTNGQVLGYAKRDVGSEIGEEVWGRTYSEASIKTSDGNGNELSPWIKDEFSLWVMGDCDSTEWGCVDGLYVPKIDDQGVQIRQEGYAAEIKMKIINSRLDARGDVLGIETEGIVLAEEVEGEATSGAGLGIVESGDGWVEIASESASVNQVKKVDLPQIAKKQAVINLAMMRLLGLSENDAIGKQISVSYVVMSELLNSEDKVESAPQDYTIVGLVPDESSAYFYVPFIDMRGLGVVNYSQIKVLSKNNDILGNVRRKIESMGFATRSVADTVVQIERLFGTVRSVLGVLGMVALLVAALGMFNTLTVSLLERTREVGLMKAMGMKSQEVNELFLAESMVMGFFGGLLGIFLGWAGGKGVGLVLSIFSVSQGVGYLDVSYLPMGFAALVFGLSLLVGLGTGIYPAKRATRISALNAMRYE